MNYEYDHKDEFIQTLLKEIEYLEEEKKILLRMNSRYTELLEAYQRVIFSK